MIERRQTFSVTGAPNVDVRIPTGSVRVRAGDVDEVVVVARGRDTDDLTIVSDGNDVTISHERRTSAAVAHHVEITVAEGASFAIRTASAEVRIDVGAHDVRVETASGDVSVTTVSGGLDVRTASGSVTAGDCRRTSRIRTASGDVHIRYAHEGATVVTASGEVRIDGASGDVTAKTASGAVSLECFDGHVFSAKTISSDVRIGVPSGRKLHVDLNTLSGEVRLPSDPADGSHHDDAQRMRLRVRTVSGDVTVLTRS